MKIISLGKGLNKLSRQNGHLKTTAAEKLVIGIDKITLQISVFIAHDCSLTIVLMVFKI